MKMNESEIIINNTKQNILTLCSDKKNPILLIVHGGPGSPDRPLVCKYNRALAGYYTIICWDQRCSGLSYSRENRKEPLTVDVMLSDLKELVIYLTDYYKQEKIYLAGHSYGAYLGLRFVQQYPQYVKYYIGTGQGVSSAADEIYKYDFVRQQATEMNDQRVISKLNDFGIPDGKVYPKDTEKARKFVGNLVHKYGGYIHPDSHFSMKSYLALYLKYYGINTVKVLKGIGYSVKSLNPEIDREDRISCITSLQVPILLISGERDYICPVPAVKKWFDSLSAPKKKFVVLPKAAHMVNFERSGEWNQELIRIKNEIIY